MTEMRVIVPAELEEWIKARVAEGRHVDASDYIRDLIRRDQEGLVSDNGETPEYVAWVREMIAEGEASGLSEKDPFELLDDLRAGKHDAEG